MKKVRSLAIVVSEISDKELNCTLDTGQTALKYNLLHLQINRRSVLL